ncbi:MAG TPA: hypothetical protein VIL79_06035, partial [Thermoleophilia bacterium]
PPAPPADLTAALAAAAQLTWFRAVRDAAAAWLDPAAARELIAAYRVWGKERGIGARELLMPLRIALTGAEHGPELPFVLAALERDVTLMRLDNALAGEPTTTPGDTP